MSVTTVIGPTPPGTGVSHAALSAAFLASRSPHNCPELIFLTNADYLIDGAKRLSQKLACAIHDKAHRNPLPF